MNLSNKKFTKHEFDLLNKNLNFCPRPNQFNKSNFNKDLQAFFRRVKLKAHFRNNQPYEPSEEDLFGPPKDSTWTPKYVNHTVETFIAAASKDFENFKGKKLPNDNLNKMERRALSDLQKREDIIITKADKGGATVIIDVEDYIREANSQLENTEFYEKLNFNPTEGYSNIVDNRLDELTEEGDLSEEIAEGLKTDNPLMGKFEEQFIYPAIRGLHRLYLRYIDDIFIIWTGTKERFKEFVKELNLRHPSIKFDYNISNKEVSFLDTIVYIDKNNKLRTKLYPENLKKNIPFSQVLRARRICSEKADFDQACEELRERFIERGYHPDEVEEQIKKTSSVKPGNLSGTKKTSKRIPFVVTYNRTLPPISKILRKHWNILQLDKNLQNLFEEPPVIAYRRCRNLQLS